MNQKKTKHGIPIVGGNIPAIGMFTYTLIVILSDHLKPEDQEMVIYQYSEKSKAMKMRETIKTVGCNLTKEEGGVEMECYYPPSQIRKILLKKEPVGIGPKGKVTH